MESFSEQCLDMARSMLSHNMESINQDGTITPVEGEAPRLDESGHAALAIGEFYRATGETELEGKDLIDLAARCITAQVFRDPPQENGLAYAALALLSFGPSKERNPVWERLVDETRERLDKLLLNRSDYDNHWQTFNIAKAVCRFSLGLSKKDETGRLIERFLDRIDETSSSGYFDDVNDGIGGDFSLQGVMAFVFTRQSLQLHSNPGLRERKLPSLRTYAEKYIKMLPDLVREDGLGWAFSKGSGAYGQMHLISLLLQGFRDGWVPEDRKPKYFDLLRRLFYFFYATYLDQEHGYLVVRDEERTALTSHTTRLSNFDGARFPQPMVPLVERHQSSSRRWQRTFQVRLPLCHFRQIEQEGARSPPLPQRRFRSPNSNAARILRFEDHFRLFAFSAFARNLRLAE